MQSKPTKENIIKKPKSQLPTLKQLSNNLFRMKKTHFFRPPAGPKQKGPAKSSLPGLKIFF